jgi:hypothetical protein
MNIWESIAEAIQRDPIPVLGILIGCTAGVLIVAVASLAKAWSRVRTVEAETALKQDMIARGMSADEIERVIRASGSPRNDRPPSSVDR